MINKSNINRVGPEEDVSVINFKNKINKKGMIGSFITTFVATIIIALILLIFVLGSGVVKKIANVDNNVAIYSEKDVEINNIFNYMSEYSSLLEAKFNLEGSMSLDKFPSRGAYDK